MLLVAGAVLLAVLLVAGLIAFAALRGDGNTRKSTTPGLVSLQARPIWWSGRPRSGRRSRTRDFGRAGGCRFQDDPSGRGSRQMVATGPRQSRWSTAARAFISWIFGAQRTERFPSGARSTIRWNGSNHHRILYGYDSDLWELSVEGRNPPRTFLSKATSPAVLRSPGPG
jgi:hypothetical protein